MGRRKEKNQRRSSPEELAFEWWKKSTIRKKYSSELELLIAIVKFLGEKPRASTSQIYQRIFRDSGRSPKHTPKKEGLLAAGHQ